MDVITFSGLVYIFSRLDQTTLFPFIIDLGGILARKLDVCSGSCNSHGLEDLWCSMASDVALDSRIIFLENEILELVKLGTQFVVGVA